MKKFIIDIVTQIMLYIEDFEKNTKESLDKKQNVPTEFFVTKYGNSFTVTQEMLDNNIYITTDQDNALLQSISYVDPAKPDDKKFITAWIPLSKGQEVVINELADEHSRLLLAGFNIEIQWSSGDGYAATKKRDHFVTSNELQSVLENNHGNTDTTQVVQIDTENDRRFSYTLPSDNTKIRITNCLGYFNSCNLTDVEYPVSFDGSGKYQCIAEYILPDTFMLCDDAAKYNKLIYGWKKGATVYFDVRDDDIGDVQAEIYNK